LITPKELMPQLRKRVGDKSAKTRATVVTALKYAITDSPHVVDAELATCMDEFIALLKDEDLVVRRSTLMTLNYAAHNKPALIRAVLSAHLPALYEETKVKQSLIKVVDLGPFKHKVDEGLENRKAAFECMYTLLDTCIDKLDIAGFIPNLVEGLADVYDIKLLCQLMLVKMAQHSPASLLTGLDQLIEPLRKTITAKVRETAVKQQVDRNEELIRSALRAIAAISYIPDIDSSVKFEDLVKTTIKGGPYAEQYANILKELAPKTTAVASSD